MSQENVEALRRAYEAFSRGDLDAAFADVAPDMEYVASGAIPDRLIGGAGHHRLGQGDIVRGAEEYKRFISWLTDVFDDARVEPKDFIDSGDEVVVGGFTIRGRGKQSGVETSWTLWQVWTLREGKFVHGKGFTSREEALEAAGLSE